MKEMHLMEGRNTGFRKIRNALHNNGSPEPLFETDDERTYFATTLFIHPDFVPEKKAVNKNDRVNDNLNKNEKYVLEMMWNNPDITAIRLAEYMGGSESTIRRTIKSLKSRGIIRRIGTDKNGQWEILQ